VVQCAGGVLIGGGGVTNVVGTRGTLTNVTITAISPYFAGLLVNGGNTATMSGGSITITGNGGIDANGNIGGLLNGTATAAGVMVATNNAPTNNASATLTDVAILTNGSSSPGGVINGGGTVAINGGSVTTLGSGSFGFLLAAPAGGAAGGSDTLQISNGATVNSAADAFNVQGQVADITVNGSSVTGNNGVLLSTLSGGTTNLTATASQLSGAITTDSSSSADVFLKHNSVLTGAINPQITHPIAPGG
jgi:hypothetical protein